VKKVVALLILGLSACSPNVEMKSVQYDYLLNDGNSKVWMIEQMIVNKSNIAPTRNVDKELIIFYENGRFNYVPMKQLGDRTGKTGDYFLDSDDRLLKLYFPKSTWEFSLKEIEEDSIYLVPTAVSDVDFSIQLVPIR